MSAQEDEVILAKPILWIFLIYYNDNNDNDDKTNGGDDSNDDLKNNDDTDFISTQPKKLGITLFKIFKKLLKYLKLYFVCSNNFSLHYFILLIHL